MSSSGCLLTSCNCNGNFNDRTPVDLLSMSPPKVVFELVFHQELSVPVGEPGKLPRPSLRGWVRIFGPPTTLPCVILTVVVLLSLKRGSLLYPPVPPTSVVSSALLRNLS